MKEALSCLQDICGVSGGDRVQERKPMTLHEVVQLCNIKREAQKAWNREAITREWWDLAPRDKILILLEMRWKCTVRAILRA